MDWVACLREAVGYMEKHLLEPIGAREVARHVHVSPFYLQRGFAVMTGMSIGEYIRSRRLYLAALDMMAGPIKIIDLAAKYGYETPESFSKAFRRFHGVSPSALGHDAKAPRIFLPLQISIEIKGGAMMDFRIEKMDAFKVIGCSCQVPTEQGYRRCPEFWDEFIRGYCRQGAPKAVAANRIGELALCINDGDPAAAGFTYMIAGFYQGGEVPTGMELYDVPSLTWAKFTCIGPLPGALQAVNTRIWKEWLPNNPDYTLAADISIEWYSGASSQAADYRSEIWLPVVYR